jgi:hypothetical protein
MALLILGDHIENGIKLLLFNLIPDTLLAFQI